MKHNSFEYDNADEWERLPKTDYTYANSMSYNRSYEEKYTIPNMSRSSMHRQRQHTNTSTAVKLPNLRSTEYIFQSTPAPTHSNTSLSHHFQQISQINLEKISDSDSTATSSNCHYNLRSRGPWQTTDGISGGEAGDVNLTLKPTKSNSSTNTISTKLFKYSTSSLQGDLRGLKAQRGWSDSTVVRVLNSFLLLVWSIISLPFTACRHVYQKLLSALFTTRTTHTNGGGGSGVRKVLSDGVEMKNVRTRGSDMKRDMAGVGSTIDSSQNSFSATKQHQADQHDYSDNEYSMTTTQTVITGDNDSNSNDKKTINKKLTKSTAVGAYSVKEVAGPFIKKKVSMLSAITSFITTFIETFFSYLAYLPIKGYKAIASFFHSTSHSGTPTLKSQRRDHRSRPYCYRLLCLLLLLSLLAVPFLLYGFYFSSSSSFSPSSSLSSSMTYLAETLPSANQVVNRSSDLAKGAKQCVTDYLLLPATVLLGALWDWSRSIKMPVLWSGGGGSGGGGGNYGSGGSGGSSSSSGGITAGESNRDAAACVASKAGDAGKVTGGPCSCKVGEADVQKIVATVMASVMSQLDKEKEQLSTLQQQQQQQLQQFRVDQQSIEENVEKQLQLLQRQQQSTEQRQQQRLTELDLQLKAIPTSPPPPAPTLPPPPPPPAPAPAPAPSTRLFYTKQEVEELIRAKIQKYDADKTGLVDFAFEPAGGSLVSTRCSKTYRGGMSLLSMFGVPLFYAYNSPRTIIQPGNLPGDCWAFQGGMGFAVVRLQARVFIKSVSIEHIHRNITRFGNINSAPKDFSIWGLSGEEDNIGVLIGNFTYDITLLDNLQFFSIPVEHQKNSYEFVELRIYNNHGNPLYTCLYRFRVHGEADVPAGGDTAEVPADTSKSWWWWWG